MVYFIDLTLYFLSVVIFWYSLRKKNGTPTNWPIVGMLPALIKNMHRVNDFIIEAAGKSHLSFVFKGPWFCNMDILVSVDPANVHHVLIKNFKNYHKGSKYNENFDVFGEGVLNSDGHIWQYHRKIAQSFIAHPRFQPFLVQKIWEKVETGLIPLLDRVSKQGLEIDLQDLFSRLTFDTICTIIMDHDPESLTFDFPDTPPSKALDEVEEVIMARFTTPAWIWKLQRWLNVGLEKKYKQAWQTLDAFVYKSIDRKKEEMITKDVKEDQDEVRADILSLYMDDKENKKSDKFLRDTVLAFLIAGRDTTTTALSWFFYLLSLHPEVLSKIKEELDRIGTKTRLTDETTEPRKLQVDFDKLVYLHAALCEALRLYPPVVFEAKAPIEQDVLPSGHKVYPSTLIAFDLYAMARMKEVWGDDCYEFKPERWISEEGKNKYEPAYKFPVFNAGPRTCLGKNMALTQMKVVAATIIKNYNIEAVKAHPVVPELSIILRMKYGFRVKVLKS